MSKTTLMPVIQEHTDSCYQQMKIVQKFASGNVSLADLKKYVRRHYAEIRTFIEFKLPERIRICPKQANSAKKYFWVLLGEESGNFEPGRDHAELFKPVCSKLGITDEELEEEYKHHLKRFLYLKDAEPSWNTLVGELAISYAWESFITKAGANIIQTLRQRFGFDDETMSYFEIHVEADAEHSDFSAKILSEYVTDRESLEIAINAITETLLTNNYFDD